MGRVLVVAATVAAALLLGAGAAAAADGVGVHDPARGEWHLRQDDGLSVRFLFGNPGDAGFMGDWDCDGDATPGLYRRSDGFVYLRNSNTTGIADIRFFFGNPGDLPIAGDFDADGCDTVSLYRPSTQEFFIVDELGSEDRGLGAADTSFVFGNPLDQPVAGDWDGDGASEVGLHRASTGLFYWRDTLTAGVADGSIIFGNPGDVFVAGDWGPPDGRDTPAVFRPADATFFFRHSLTPGIAESQLDFGVGTMTPLAGDLGLPPFGYVERGWIIETLDTAAGKFASLAFPADGRPLVAYGEDTAVPDRYDLAFAKCRDSSCRDVARTSTGQRLSDHTSLAVAPGGPVATYHDIANRQLNLVRCSDDACTRSETVAIAPNGVLSSLAVDPAGRAIAAFLDSDVVDLKTVRCVLGGRTCPAPDINLLDFGGANFELMDVAIGGDGLPVVSAMRQSVAQADISHELYLYHCTDPACDGHSRRLVTTLMKELAVLGFTSIATGADGLPIVAAAASPATAADTPTGLVVAACHDAACTASTVTTHGPPDGEVTFPSVAIGADGLPLVAYTNAVDGRLEVLRCLTPRCDGATETFPVDTAAAYVSLGVDPFGIPWIAYHHLATDELRLARLLT